MRAVELAVSYVVLLFGLLELRFESSDVGVIAILIAIFMHIPTEKQTAEAVFKKFKSEALKEALKRNGRV